jgi:nitroimidazol reductase NimA-like FMN-containing flavoprotein (pyridoxamine 5'-phosphate oxidase superfamily)
MVGGQYPMKIIAAYTLPQTGPATRTAVDRFLAAPRLMRLGVTEPDGTPLVHPVWYTWEHDQFLLHIPTKSPKRMAIEAQPTVYFTVDDKGPGIFGVRGKARAAIDPNRERLREVLEDQWDRYTGGSDTEARRLLMSMVETRDLILAVLTPRYLATWGL